MSVVSARAGAALSVWLRRPERRGPPLYTPGEGRVNGGVRDCRPLDAGQRPHPEPVEGWRRERAADFTSDAHGAGRPPGHGMRGRISNPHPVAPGGPPDEPPPARTHGTSLRENLQQRRRRPMPDTRPATPGRAEQPHAPAFSAGFRREISPTRRRPAGWRREDGNGFHIRCPWRRPAHRRPMARRGCARGAPIWAHRGAKLHRLPQLPLCPEYG
jgi:hypothetical protein